MSFNQIVLKIIQIDIFPEPFIYVFLPNTAYTRFYLKKGKRKKNKKKYSSKILIICNRASTTNAK